MMMTLNENFFAPVLDCPKCSTPDDKCNDWVLVDIFEKDEQHETPYMIWACASCGHNVKVTWVLTTVEERWPDCECDDCFNAQAEGSLAPKEI